MTTAGVAAFLLASVIGLPQSFWAVVSALIVTQGNVGGSIKAALDRFIGSVFGAVFGSAVALAVPHQDFGGRVLALIVAVAPLSIMAAASPGFRVAPITAVIVLLSVSGATLGPFGFAVDRILEVGLGCGIGLLISVTIVPRRASRMVLETAADVAQLLTFQIEALASQSNAGQTDPAATARMVRRKLSALETLVGETARERRSRLSDGPDPEPLFRSLLRLRHDVVVLRRSLREPTQGEIPTSVRDSLISALSVAAEALRAVGHALAQSRAPKPSSAIQEAVKRYRSSLEDLWAQDMRGRRETVWALSGAAFGLEQFRRDLDDLAERATDFAGAPSR
jgi:uncharacterized membrane protein YccC